MTTILEESYLIVTARLKGSDAPQYLTDRVPGSFGLGPLADAEHFEDEARARQWMGVYRRLPEASDLIPGSLRVVRLRSKTWLEPVDS